MLAAGPFVATGLTFQAVEGTSVADQEVATFQTPVVAPTAAQFQATVDFGDGTAPIAGLIFEDASGTFHVDGGHVYTAPGTFTTTVTVAGPNGTTAVGTGAATVRSAPIALQASPLTLFEGEPLGGPLVAGTFTSPNPYARASEYTAAVSWGDGTTSTATVSADSPGGNLAHFLITATHDGPFTFADTYQTQVVVSQTSGTASALGTLIVTPAALSATMVPLADAPERSLAGGLLAEFISANPKAQVSDFTATLNWNDGTALTGGYIAQNGGPGTAFEVYGSHTYLSALSSTATVFPVQVAIRSAAGAAANVTDSLRVTAVPIGLTGALNPADDSGVSHTDGITNVRAPRFSGSSAAGSLVTLYATPAGGTVSSVIGQALTDASGSWNITSRALVDGSYAVFATAADQAGFNSAQVVIEPDTHPLVIDTRGPVVDQVQLGRLTGQVLVVFQAGPAGLDIASLQNPANYSLARTNGREAPLTVSSIALGPNSGPDTPESVLLTFNAGKYVRGGTFRFIARSGGVADAAGNALDGEFTGSFPSGNGSPGGDFVATLRAVHRTVFAPGSTVGTATAPGVTGTTRVNVPAYHAGRRLVVVSANVHNNTVAARHAVSPTHPARPAPTHPVAARRVR